LPGDFLQDVETLFRQMPHWQNSVRVEFIGTRVAKADEQMRAFKYQLNLIAGENYPKDVANSMIRASDIVLLLTPQKMERYLPAKLFEYAAAGKPILVHGAPGAASQIVSQLGAGYFIPAGDPAALGQALKDILGSPAGKWNTGERRVWVNDHTREALSHRFFGILDEACAKQQRPT
jgi:glycosyltransferase involved in cell wall biosynthesis